MKLDLVCIEDRCWCDLGILWFNSGGLNWGVLNLVVF